MKKVEVFTDGACKNNPGPGGWGAILRYNNHEKEISGGDSNTTNNRMELTAVIEALNTLKEPCEVTLYSDSKYVCDSITKGWAKTWQKNSWKKGNGKKALNPDLWQKLLSLTDKHVLTIVWIQGHNGHPENERCDKLAVSEAAKIKAKLLNQ